MLCQGCHGGTHAEWPNPNPAANDNVAASQLQGHAGTLVECTTCHAANSLGLTLNGPHGMHPVNDRNWNLKHKSVAENNRDTCRACHGMRGEGTPLAARRRHAHAACRRRRQPDDHSAARDAGAVQSLPREQALTRATTLAARSAPRRELLLPAPSQPGPFLCPGAATQGGPVPGGRWRGRRAARGYGRCISGIMIFSSTSRYGSAETLIPPWNGRSVTAMK